MCGQPFLQRGVDARLPARPGCLEAAQNIFRQADARCDFRMLRFRTTAADQLASFVVTGPLEEVVIELWDLLVLARRDGMSINLAQVAGDIALAPGHWLSSSI